MHALSDSVTELPTAEQAADFLFKFFQRKTFRTLITKQFPQVSAIATLTSFWNNWINFNLGFGSVEVVKGATYNKFAILETVFFC